MVKPSRINPLADKLIIYFLLTPLFIIFWAGTYGMIKYFILDRAKSTLWGAMTSFSTGAVIKVGCVHLPYFIDRQQFDQESSEYLILARVFNAVLGVAHIMHFRGIELFFMEVCANENVALMVMFAIIPTLLLYWLRCYRNVVDMPLIVHIDDNIDDWFDFPTLYKYSGRNLLKYSVDVLVTVFVALSLVPLHWVTVTWVLDLLIYPNEDDYSKSATVSLLFGYTVVAIAQALQSYGQRVSKDLDKRPVLKTLFEDAYLTSAMIGVISVWKGGLKVIEAIERNYPITIGGCDDCDESSHSDITWICYQLGSCLLFVVLYASNNLPTSKGLRFIDGSQKKGAGLDLHTEYLDFVINGT